MIKTISAFLICLAAFAQDSPNRLTVPFSDSARPRTLSANLMQGCLTVEGYDGKDVIVQTSDRHSERRDRRVPSGAEGMKRIDPAGMGLTVEEENNTVRIHSNSGNHGDLLVRVPYATSLKLKCMNGGDLKVSHVTGEIELSNLNGGVLATGVSGSILAHSMNGKVVAMVDRVNPGKPMSFSSMNGDVDVTLPSDLRANVKMKSDNGDVYSDFDVKLSPTANAPLVEDGRSHGGKYRVKIDRTTAGSINGGGPDFDFKTFNGNVYIRKKK